MILFKNGRRSFKKYPNNPQKACKEFIKDQAIKCGATGFVTGLAGIITIPLAVTADIGVTYGIFRVKNDYGNCCYLWF